MKIGAAGVTLYLDAPSPDLPSADVTRFRPDTRFEIKGELDSETVVEAFRVDANDGALIQRLVKSKPQIDAEGAFKLHDTYGFPIDLTRIMAEERGMSVDIAGYETLMEEAKERARAGGKEGTSRLYELPPDVLAKLKEDGIKPTDDSFKFDAAPIG